MASLALSSSLLVSSRHPSSSVSAQRQWSAVVRQARCAPRCCAFFKLGGHNAESAGIFASQGRDDYSKDDVALYYDYSGMLAAEGTYDKMEKLLSLGTHPADILLMMAASEGDRPKIEELLRAGARCDVADAEGRTALDRACDDETREVIQQYALVAN